MGTVNPLRHSTILVVDDSQLVLDSIKVLLQDYGCKVLTCDYPDSVVEILKKTIIDAVLTDIKMPKVTGLELLERIRVYDKNMPVILMTAYADLDTAVNAVKKGAFDFIIKPYKERNLLNSLTKAVEHHYRSRIENDSVAVMKEKFAQTKLDWESIFDAMTDMITIHDNEFNIVYANKAARDVLAASFTDEIWPKCYKSIHGTEEPPKGCPSCSCLKTKKSVSYEIYEPHLRMFIEIRAIPRINSKNEVIGIIHIIRDITERKVAEEELIRSQRAAIEAYRVKSEFLANMSHEMRTPMNGVIGIMDVMLDSTLTPEQMEHIEMAKASAESMLNLLNDLLCYSKIESGKLTIEKDSFSLRASIKRSIDTLSLQIKDKGLELACAVSEGVPDQLVGDAGRLGQILLNLIGNAVKFTETGKISVDVSTERTTGNEIVLKFAISDTGIGIPENHLDVIFDSFTQVDSTNTRKYGGAGLGLSISKSLVKMMHGRIWVKSTLGQGSTFYFTLTAGICGGEDTDVHSGEFTYAVGGMDGKHKGPSSTVENHVSKKQRVINELRIALEKGDISHIEQYVNQIREFSGYDSNNTEDDAFRILLAANNNSMNKALMLLEKIEKCLNDGCK